MRDLDQSWHSGMDEDLKEKTVEEIFALLIPRSNLKGARSALPPKSRLHKDSKGRDARKGGFINLDPL